MFSGGFPGCLDPGQIATYDTAARPAGGLFDYWVQASYYTGPGSNTPPEWVDSALGLNRNWRFFWKGWKLITHHEELIISMGKPDASIHGPDTKGRIEIINHSFYPIKFDVRYDRLKVPTQEGTLAPGKSVSFRTDDWLEHQYYLGLEYWSKGFVPGVTETWTDFWAEWKPVGRNATVTITQTAPTISPLAGDRILNECSGRAESL